MNDTPPQSADSAHSEPAVASPQAALPGVRVRVIGVGGGGGNAVEALVADERVPVSKVVVNTDAQALNENRTAEKLLVGRTLTRGLSAGGDPEVGRKVADRDRDLLLSLVQGQDLIFIVTGLGGGTGSALAPALAQMAVASGALVIGFAALPFQMEGQRKQEISSDAMASLRECCDALLTLPNDLLMQHMQEDATVLEAFERANAWIGRAIHSICTMVLRPGVINMDLAALRTAFASGGRTLFGLGRGRGADCVEEALNDLLICPLLNAPEHNRRADKLLLNIVGGKDLGLAAINRVLATVTEHFGSREQTLIGAVIDERLEREIELCVIGTSSLDGHAPRRRRPDAVPGRIGTEFADATAPALPGSAVFSNALMHPFGTPEADGETGQHPVHPGSAAHLAHPGIDRQPDAAVAPAAAQHAANLTDRGLPSHSVAGEKAYAETPIAPAGAEESATLSQSMIPGTEEEDALAERNPFARDEAFPEPSRPVHESKLKQRKKTPARPRAETDSQEEFLFVAEGEQRGLFDRTARNILDGIDLDIPTYQRRGIRIVLG